MRWDDNKFIAFDFETWGAKPEYALQPWRIPSGDAWATSLVWGRPGFSNAVNEPTTADMAAMLEYAIEHDQRIVGWNAVFDIAILLAYGLHELVYQAKWLDGMLLWRHDDIEPEYENRQNRRSYGLKEYVRQFQKQYAGYDDGIDFGSTDPTMVAKRLRYNIADVAFTFMGAAHFHKRLQGSPQRLRAAYIEADCLPLAAKANITGMPVDPIVNAELYQWLTDTADARLTDLEPHGITEKIVRSPKQLAGVLFDDWGLTPLKEGKTGPSTDKETLHELSLIDDRVALVREYREALNNRTKFSDTPRISAEYNEDGRTRPQAIIFGTYSGRFTYASKQGRKKTDPQIGFALHQAKRDPRYRNIIKAPKGYTIVEFDAAGQEFRWMAIASGDATMLRLCEPGQDPHSYMGAQVNNRDYHELIENVADGDPTAKLARQLGKVANLSLQYRTSARKLLSVARVQYGLPMNIHEAQLIHKTYQQTYPGVPRYWERQIRQTQQVGYVETFAGRRVWVLGDWEGNWGWSMGSTAINYRIQGTGADQKYLALSVLKNYIVKHGIIFAWDLHDGLYFYVPDDIVPQACRDMATMLSRLPYERAWGFKPPIELPWDCKIGKTWGKLKEINPYA